MKCHRRRASSMGAPSPLAEGRELKYAVILGKAGKHRSPLAEGRELKFIYAAIMSAVAIVAPRGGA